jgi:glycosyltransferase involved in cell wall biosynthesis
MNSTIIPFHQTSCKDVHHSDIQLYVFHKNELYTQLFGTCIYFYVAGFTFSGTLNIITLFFRLLSHPASNSILVNFRLPIAAAMCSAVSPFWKISFNYHLLVLLYKKVIMKFWSCGIYIREMLFRMDSEQIDYEQRDFLQMFSFYLQISYIRMTEKNIC